MKKLYVPFVTLLLLTACGAPAEEAGKGAAPVPSATTETASTVATPAPTAEPTLELHWIDSQNSKGLYQREPLYGEGGYGYGNGGIAAHYFDFTNATEQIIGEPLDLENANLQLHADEEFLYWSWSGMVNDTPHFAAQQSGRQQP